jgi:hypothetical protein
MSFLESPSLALSSTLNIASVVPRTFTMILDDEVIVKRSLLSTLSSLSIANAIHPIVK